MDPMDVLVAEHRKTEQMLEVLEQCVAGADSGEPVNRPDVASLVEFFRIVVGQVHQAREMQLLVPAMRAHGAGDESLFATVASEHEQEQELLRAVAKAAAEQDDVLLARAAYTYSDYASCHMYIEETILFSAARARLSAEAARELADRFREFDLRIQSVAGHDALRAAAEELAVRYGNGEARGG